MQTKKQLKSLVSQNKTKQAIEELLQITQELEDKDLHDETVIQCSKFEKYQEENRKDTTSQEELNISLARIHNALLQIIEKLPDEHKTAKKQEYTLWQYITAAAVIVSILGGLAEFLNYIDIVPNSTLATDSNTVTILAHGKAGKDHRVLPGRGVITLAYGDALVAKPTNKEGEVTFRQIADVFFEPKSGVEIWFKDPEGEPYRAAYPDSLYRLTRGQFISLEVVLLGMDKINGIVKDFRTGKTLAGVRIRVKGEEALTNKFGEFFLEIPENKQEKFITIRAFKEGYTDYEISQVPTTTEREIAILMKPE